MTREEAEDKAIELDDNGLNCEVQELISEIYDDFESQICENCKYYMIGADESTWCGNKENSTLHHFQTPLDDDFGCVNFERKDK